MNNEEQLEKRECSIKCVIVLDDDVIPDTVFKQNRQLLERGRPIL